MEYFWLIYLVSAVLTFIGGGLSAQNRPIYPREMYFLISLALLPAVNTLAALMFSSVLIFESTVWGFKKLLGMFNMTVRD